MGGIRRWGFRRRVWIGALLLAPAGLAAVFSLPRVFPGSALRLGLDALGWICFVTGAFFRFWSALYVGGRKSRVLVTEGPYSVVRNPLYAGSFCLSLSVAFFLQSLTFAAALAAAAVAHALTTVPAEEAYLRGLHGDDFVRYRESVPGFWPRPARFRSPERIEVRVKALGIECRRAARWVWIPLLAEVVSHLRAQPWWPTPFRLP